MKHIAFLRSSALVVSLTAALCSSACSGSSGGASIPSPSSAPSSSSSIEQDGGPAGDGAIDARVDAAEASAQCNALENAASDVDVVSIAADPPAPEGGAIADGTYVVTSATRYTGQGGAAGPTGQKVRMTFRFALPRVESVFEEVHRNATAVVDGTKLVTTTTCPGTAVDETGYTATGSTLSVHITKSSGTVVYVLTRSGS